MLRLAKPDEAYFWATQQGAELGLLMLKGQQRVGVEFKRADAPSATRSMQIALQDLKLDALHVVYPGEHGFRLAPGVEAVPLRALLAPSAAGRSVTLPLLALDQELLALCARLFLLGEPLRRQAAA